MATITGTLVDNSGQERIAGTFTFPDGTTLGNITVTGLTATTVSGSTSVTTPLVKASVAATGVKVADTGDKLGFYGTAPVSLQTGVAVSSAGIHAALVALGLITA